VPDDLARWAAQRAPELVARAESEAVEELKRALVKAATGARRAPEQEPRPAPRSPAGDGLWAYCVTRAEDRPPEKLAGVHGGAIERIERDGLAVLVSRVPLAEFSEEPLRRNLNDLEWLERVAREHEAALERVLNHDTIIPLRICTIFEDEEGVARMLAEQRPTLDIALDALAGKEEWGVKLLVDRSALEAAAEERVPPEEDLAGRSAGGAYMLRRRQERQLRDVADRLAGELAEDVHARLQDWASDAVVNRPQNRDLSGHEGEMLLNAAYLVERAKVERLRELVEELQDRHRDLGARLELTGPWPPYNFVPGTEAAAV
jgi:Gas vesicle synthesis protein GvpL/GvpF